MIWAVLGALMVLNCGVANIAAPKDDGACHGRRPYLLSEVVGAAARQSTYNITESGQAATFSWEGVLATPNNHQSSGIFVRGVLGKLECPWGNFSSGLFFKCMILIGEYHNSVISARVNISLYSRYHGVLNGYDLGFVIQYCEPSQEHVNGWRRTVIPVRQFYAARGVSVGENSKVALSFNRYRYPRSIFGYELFVGRQTRVASLLPQSISGFPQSPSSDKQSERKEPNEKPFVLVHVANYRRDEAFNPAGDWLAIIIPGFFLGPVIAGRKWGIYLFWWTLIAAAIWLAAVLKLI